jgi:hypothetical protein
MLQARLTSINEEKMLSQWATGSLTRASNPNRNANRALKIAAN